MDNPNNTPDGHNLPVRSVTELSADLRRTVEGTFSRVRVRGEISGFKRPGSGHLYFALKDVDAVLDAVCWKGTAGRLSLSPEDGIEVIATGRLTTYAGRSKYQMVVEDLELAGEGALLKLLEERKRALAAEGLFDPARKRPIPFLPEVIGVVTSPTGAVIRDILHRLSDRFPRHVLVWPVLVQGQGAAEQVAAAIRGFNALAAGGAVPRPDLLIVARGGGSLEDLWAFNEEAVVRAAAESVIPLISAVGHETDTTLIDFAADVRAPTPTAAAEMAVPVRAELLAQVMDDGARLVAAGSRLLTDRRRALEAAARALPKLDRIVGDMAQRLDERGERLSRAGAVFFERKQARMTEAAARITHPRRMIEAADAALRSEVRAFAAAARAATNAAAARLERPAALLESLSYARILERGFVLATDADGRAVTEAAACSGGQTLDLHFHDGRVRALVDGGAPKRKSAPPKGNDDRQGNLL